MGLHRREGGYGSCVLQPATGGTDLPGAVKAAAPQNPFKQTRPHDQAPLMSSELSASMVLMPPPTTMVATHPPNTLSPSRRTLYEYRAVGVDGADVTHPAVCHVIQLQRIVAILLQYSTRQGG